MFGLAEPSETFTTWHLLRGSGLLPTPHPVSLPQTHISPKLAPSQVTPPAARAFPLLVEGSRVFLPKTLPLGLCISSSLNQDPLSPDLTKAGSFHQLGVSPKFPHSEQMTVQNSERGQQQDKQKTKQNTIVFLSTPPPNSCRMANLPSK